MLTHHMIDKRSFDMSVFLVNKLEENKHKIEYVRQQWAYWKNLPGFSCSAIYRTAWDHAIKNGIPAIKELVLRKDDFGDAIRQTSPLGCLWESEQERLDFLRTWKASHVRTNNNMYSGTAINSKSDFIAYVQSI